ncbi:hypothetical protein ANTRET_LOCUS10194 [Anthophora retusa]
MQKVFGVSRFVASITSHRCTLMETSKNFLRRCLNTETFEEMFESARCVRSKYGSSIAASSERCNWTVEIYRFYLPALTGM